MAPKRTSRGKQKREMKKIEKKNELFVAFTKRKSGIYNKASELSTLCGAFVDILMISPKGKPYCYGEPSSQSISRNSLKDENPSVVEEFKKQKIVEHNRKNDYVLDKKYVAEARRENLKTLVSSGYWSIKEDVKSYQYDQVKEVDTSLVNFTNKIINNVLSKGGEINHHAISSIDELNGVKTNPPYVFGAIFPPSEALGLNLYDPKGKGKVVTASRDTNQTQGLNLVGATASGSDAPQDI